MSNMVENHKTIAKYKLCGRKISTIRRIHEQHDASFVIKTFECRWFGAGELSGAG